MKKIISLKLAIVLEFQKTKTFLLKDMFRIGQKKFLLLAKLKTVSWTYAISDVNAKKITGSFNKKRNAKNI